MGLFSFRKKEAESATPKRGSRTRSSRTAAVNEYSDHEQLDPLLPEKQRARRRLVGALALVLAAVIILPMVLAPEPKPDTSGIALQIPNKDANLPPVQAKDTAQSLDNGEEIVPVSGRGDGAAKNPATPQTPAPAQLTDTVPALAKPDNAKAAAAPPERTASKKEAAKPAPVEKSADKSSNETTTKLADKGTPSTAANTRANAPNAGKGHFLIRIGAFSDPQRAKNWLVKLKLADVPSYIEPKKMGDGRTLYLLRSGPFNSRESAETAGKKVRQMGLTAQIAEVS